MLKWHFNISPQRKRIKTKQAMNNMRFYWKWDKDGYSKVNIEQFYKAKFVQKRPNWNFLWKRRDKQNSNASTVWIFIKAVRAKLFSTAWMGIHSCVNIGMRHRHWNWLQHLFIRVWEHNAGRGGRPCLCWFKHNTAIRKATLGLGERGGSVIKEHPCDHLWSPSPTILTDVRGTCD